MRNTAALPWTLLVGLLAASGCASARALQTSKPDHDKLWKTAIADVRASATYQGLALAKQDGLVPLGLDPQSGLQEFLHLGTHVGVLPQRDATGQISVTESTGIIFVLIPRGTFWMGAQQTDPSATNFDPQAQATEVLRQVTIDEPFFISKYEMTRGQWMRSPADDRQPFAGSEANPGDLTLPADTISWQAASDTLARMGLALPTKEQWEYAARAGTSSPWINGAKAETDLPTLGNLVGGSDGYPGPAPVGKFPPNAFGIHDVLGNHWEWLATPNINRGGSYLGNPFFARVAFSGGRGEEYRANAIGIRPARRLSQSSATPALKNQNFGRMWTFENPPLAYLEEKYGFKPDQAWLDALRLGSLRLAGEDTQSGFGSASFVSPNGLFMTSHRCVRNALAWTRPKDLDLVKIGFVAAAQEDELRLKARPDEWLTAAQLDKISDVTDEVNRGVAPTDSETRIKEKREANKQKILDAARKASPELVPRIVSLYQGAVVQLYQYKVYNDIRLVCIPHVQTAHFGGDADNFNYPRHSLDFAFLRAYQDGKPANTAKHYFRWKSGSPKKDELVFVSGNPGTTKRLFTKAQMELERDVRIPMNIEWLSDRLRLWKRPPFDPENPSRHWAWVRAMILGLENDLKVARGKLEGLSDERLMARKTAAEKAFKSRVGADKKLAKAYGDLWDRIAGVIEERRRHEARARFHSTGGLINGAITIVRSCDPAETEENRRQARQKLEGWRSGIGLPNGPSRGHFVDHVARARSWLPEDDPYFSKVLGGRSGEDFLMAVIGPGNAGHQRGPKVRTLVHYPEQRDALVKSGWKGIQNCEDPAIVAARELVILVRENKNVGDELDAKEEALGAEIGRVLLACYGTNVSPDATATLRFTDGVVRGYPRNGTIAPHRTSFYALYGRNAAFDNNYPFKLPKIWLDRRDAIDMTKSVNFVSTNDITVGNAGSVVVNKALEVVGVVIDGNNESLHNDFVFKDDVPRAVSAHVDGIMEALMKIYDAHRVARELTDASKTESPPRLLPELVLKGHTKNVRWPTFSPEGSRIVTGSDDGTARLWDSTGKPLAVLVAHPETVSYGVFSRDGSRIVTITGGDAERLWDSNGKPLAVLQHEAGIYSVGVSPDGRIVTASGGTARLWDRDGKKLTELVGHTKHIDGVEFSPDGSRFLTASYDNTARLWDSAGKPLAVLGNTEGVFYAGFSPDGNRIVTDAVDKTVRLWNRDGKEIAVLPGSMRWDRTSRFSPDGSRFVTAAHDRTARLYDSNGKEIAVLAGHTGEVWEARFSPDGKRIYTASDDGTARLWDREGRPLAVLDGHTDLPMVVYSPDGSALVTTSRDDQTPARLWDRDGNHIADFGGHRGVFRAAFSPNGSRVVVGSADNTALVYRVPTALRDSPNSTAAKR